MFTELGGWGWFGDGLGLRERVMLVVKGDARMSVYDAKVEELLARDQ